MLKHLSSTYCSSTPPESAIASLVSTTICNASIQMLVMDAGLALDIPISICMIPLIIGVTPISAHGGRMEIDLDNVAYIGE